MPRVHIEGETEVIGWSIVFPIGHIVPWFEGNIPHSNRHKGDNPFFKGFALEVDKEPRIQIDPGLNLKVWERALIVDASTQRGLDDVILRSDLSKGGSGTCLRQSIHGRPSKTTNKIGCKIVRFTPTE